MMQTYKGQLKLDGEYCLFETRQPLFPNNGCACIHAEHMSLLNYLQYFG